MSVTQTSGGAKLEKAKDFTEKLRQKQEEHERQEKEKMEQVFSQYMERRLKAEEVVKKLSKDHLEKHKHEKQLANEKLQRIRSQHEQILREEDTRRKKQLAMKNKRHMSQSP